MSEMNYKLMMYLILAIVILLIMRKILIYYFNKEDLEKTDAYGISDEYRNIDQHETDNIENDEVKFFVWSLEDLWGFKVLSILRQDDELYLGKEQFFYFENDQWEKNFFDGMK